MVNGARPRFVCLFVVLVIVVAARECLASETEQVLTIATGGWHVLRVDNRPLLDWRYLYSWRSISVSSPEPDVLYTIWYGNDPQAIQRGLQSGASELQPGVRRVGCSYASKNSQAPCTFLLNYYGVNDEWWVPRAWYLLEAPPPTFVALYIPNEDGSAPTRSCVLVLSETDSTYGSMGVAVLLGAIALFLVAPALGRSLAFYLVGWFLCGVLLSLVALLVIALYVGLKVGPRMGSLVGLLSSALVIGWGSFYYNALVQFAAQPEQHR